MAISYPNTVSGMGELLGASMREYYTPEQPGSYAVASNPPPEDWFSKFTSPLLNLARTAVDLKRNYDQASADSAISTTQAEVQKVIAQGNVDLAKAQVAAQVKAAENHSLVIGEPLAAMRDNPLITVLAIGTFVIAFLQWKKIK